MKTVAAWLLVLGLAAPAWARGGQAPDKKDAPAADKAEEKGEKSPEQDAAPRPRAVYPPDPFPPPAPPVMDPRTHAWEQLWWGDYAPRPCGPAFVLTPASPPGPVLPAPAPAPVPGVPAPGAPEPLPPPRGAASSYGRTLSLSWDRQARAWRLVDVTPQR
jgi:hypothetical protein